jgi:transposase-like protein
MDLHIPKLREGSYFPSLLEPRRRSERALLAVIQQAYVEGVSTRRVDDLVKALGCEGISKSQVSRICQELDVVVDGFMGRPLDAGPYPYLWLDALTQKVREAGRIVNVSVVVATAVNGEGKREIIGMDVGTSEDGAFWLAFLRSLSARGLSGVELVVSDAHQGLRGAIAAVFGGASWQRCRTHFMTNLLTRVPRRAQPWVATMVRTIYQQLSPAEVHGQLDRVVEQLREAFPQVAELLADAAPDLLAFTAFPVAHWQKLWSNNPQERLNREIRRRTDVVGIFPNRLSARRLVGAVLAEQHDEWAEARRYLTIPNAAGNEALPEPNMLDAAA